jgi:hypothetical protein
VPRIGAATHAFDALLISKAGQRAGGIAGCEDHLPGIDGDAGVTALAFTAGAAFGALAFRGASRIVTGDASGGSVELQTTLVAEAIAILLAGRAAHAEHAQLGFQAIRVEHAGLTLVAIAVAAAAIARGVVVTCTAAPEAVHARRLFDTKHGVAGRDGQNRE